MEVSKKNHPSLPANYVSLADLQQRWIKQQQDKIENAQETANPESLKVQEPNPNFTHKPTFRGNDRDRKGPKVYRLVQVSNPTPNSSATVKTRSEFGNGSAAKVKKSNKKRSEKKTMKEMPEFESSEIEAPVTVGVDSVIGGKLKKKKRREKKKKIKNTPQSENEATITMGVITDGGDQNANDQIGGKQQKKNNKVQKQIKKQDSVPEDQNQEKGGSEVSEKDSVGGRTVEIGRRFNQLSVTASGRGKQRWMAGSGGPRNAHGTYGSVVRREIGIKKREDGLVWVKKEVVLDHSEVS